MKRNFENNTQAILSAGKQHGGTLRKQCTNHLRKPHCETHLSKQCTHDEMPIRNDLTNCIGKPHCDRICENNAKKHLGKQR